MKKIVAVIPTYNERDNITNLIGCLLKIDPRLEILVVDDSSPDGTSDCVERIAQQNRKVSIIKRPAKLGLGSAYVDGFKHGLQMGADCIIQMDADFSHDPAYVSEFLKRIEEFDVVIGSRYVKGVNVVNWPIQRLVLSYLANLYTRIVTGLPIYDATSGFKCIRRQVLESIDLNSIISDGYCFQIEVNIRAWRKGFRICEVPIVFVERRSGRSKMSKRIIWEAIWKVWWFRFKILFNRI